MFIDDKGNFIQPDYIISFLADYFFNYYYKNISNKTVLCDIRTSKSTIDFIKNLKGRCYI